MRGGRGAAALCRLRVHSTLPGTLWPGAVILVSLLSAFPSTVQVCKEAPSQQLGDAGAHALVVSPGARSWGGTE